MRKNVIALSTSIQPLVVCDKKYGEVLGVHMIGAHVTDMIHEDVITQAAHLKNLFELVELTKANLASLDIKGDDASLLTWVAKLEKPLLKLGKCPDFVVNRGHYFGTAEFNKTAALSDDEKNFGREAELSDQDKSALIEFLKTF